MSTFETLGLSKSLLKSIDEIGFKTPTPIQLKTIPPLLDRAADLVALSQTGTGKTAAFGLPLLSLLDFSAKSTQALILCPTRELCLQITRDLRGFAKYIPEVNVVAIYGGAGIRGQIQEVQRGAQIIVGTPGRMVDMIQRKKVRLATVKYVVLDEADEMLNMGFKEDLDTILSETPDEKNTWLFSATMPDEVLRISRNYMHNPLEITIGSKNSGNENIEHIYFPVRNHEKYAALKRIADYHQDIYAIVFCRTKIETQQIADRLIKDGYSADALHGDLSQAQRDQVMKRYRSRLVQLLVATDVAARGIDVDDITHVINYNLPDELENYTHRSGRTARAGKKGISIALAGPQDFGKIRTIERIIRKKFDRGKLPSIHDVHKKQLLHIVKNVKNIPVDEDRMSSVLPQIQEELGHLSREELISRFISVEFSRLPALKPSSIDDSSFNWEEDMRNSNMVKLYINLGKFDDLDKQGLLSYISHTTGLSENDITITELKNSFSFIKIRPEQVSAVISGFKNRFFGKRPVRVEMRSNEASEVSRLRDRKYISGRNENNFQEERRSKREGYSSYKRTARQRSYSNK
jgi:ATP-dependent RNA helicase DeaD